MAEENTSPQMSKEEQIGYHKGSLSTLIAERSELIRIVSVIEQLMQAHLQELEKLGVNVAEQKK